MRNAKCICYVYCVIVTSVFFSITMLWTQRVSENVQLQMKGQLVLTTITSRKANLQPEWARWLCFTVSTSNSSLLAYLVFAPTPAGSFATRRVEMPQRLRSLSKNLEHLLHKYPYVYLIWRMLILKLLEYNACVNNVIWWFYRSWSVLSYI